VLLLDSNGKSYAASDYSGEDSQIWLTKLTALNDQREERDLLLKNAARETDTEKRLEAFVLAINTFSSWGIIGNYPELKTEVIRLDENNKAGLRAKFTVERAIGEISAVYLATNGMTAGIGELRKLLTEYPQGEAAQQLYYTMAMIESRLGRFDEARRLLNNALIAAPSSEIVEIIRTTLRSFDFSPD
jgi:tetratricopeptide (TPR) repeat protein